MTVQEGSPWNSVCIVPTICKRFWNCILMPRSEEGRRRGNLEAAYKHKTPKIPISGGDWLGASLQLHAQVYFINKLAISTIHVVSCLNSSLVSATRTEGEPPNSIPYTVLYYHHEYFYNCLYALLNQNLNNCFKLLIRYIMQIRYFIYIKTKLSNFTRPAFQNQFV